jgi:uncharacterized 2Fe-2S/4Fe-4S cluster protein (DUF4445 family)
MVETSGWVRSVVLTPPSLKDNTSDAGRLTGALKKMLRADAVRLDLDLLKALPALLRKSKYRARCVLFRDRKLWDVVALLDPDADAPATGLAIDLGTSRVVMRLVDLDNRAVLAETAFNNPQIAVGPDVLARIHHTDREDGLAELNCLIIGRINQAVTQIARDARIQPEDIYLVTVAGNTAMSHLFMGLNPHWIIREPYIPVVNRQDPMRASDLGITINARARVLVFPNIGSYFGGDVVAGILHSGLNTAADTAILVDVGTNAEVVLGNSQWLIACAGAAGPALEGGVTRMGMMAEPGVIDQIRIDPATRAFSLHTIEDQPPKGICGSGLIDLAAQLFLAGMIDLRGRLVPESCGARFTRRDGIAYLTVVPAEQSATGADLGISQIDLDSLIRSKAAMYTILETLTASVGLSPEALETFFVAGTFGSFINPESAITIGMLPDLPRNRYRSLGNSSLGGATQVLLAPESLDEIDRIRDRITYLELNVNQDFMNRFSAAKFIPHTNTSLFPSVRGFSPPHAMFEGTDE